MTDRADLAPERRPGAAGRGHRQRLCDRLPRPFRRGRPDGRLRTSTLLRYAQDIAWRHSEDLGFDRRWYTDRGRWWVVRSVDLRVLAPIGHGREPPPRNGRPRASPDLGPPPRRVQPPRRNAGRARDDGLGPPRRAWPGHADPRGLRRRLPEPELSDDIIRVSLPEAPAGAAALDLRVRPHDLDPMAHVNNAVYLDWIEEAVAAAGGEAATAICEPVPRRVAIEYAASAEPATRSGRRPGRPAVDGGSGQPVRRTARTSSGPASRRPDLALDLLERFEGGIAAGQEVGEGQGHREVKGISRRWSPGTTS